MFDTRRLSLVKRGKRSKYWETFHVIKKSATRNERGASYCLIGSVGQGVANCLIYPSLFTRRLLDHEPWSNVHRHQLLEEQLGGIRKLHLRMRNQNHVGILRKKSAVSMCLPEISGFCSCSPCTRKCCSGGWQWRSARTSCTHEVCKIINHHYL